VGWRIAFQILQVEESTNGVRFMALPFMHYQWYALLLDESIILIAAMGATWLMSRVERRRFTTFWEAPSPVLSARFSKYLLGVAVGLLLVGAYIGIIFAANGYKTGTPELHGRGIVLHGAAWVTVAAVYGMAETFLMFGYPLFTLRRSIGVSGASLLAAVLFGLRNVVWFDASVVGCSALIVQGLFLCALRFRYEDVWGVAGVYMGTVFAQNFLFSVPDGATRYTGHPRNSYLEGPFWLTGVSGGPKASLPALIVYLCALIFVVLTGWRARKQTHLSAHIVSPATYSD
jgi:hypothetical protein